MEERRQSPPRIRTLKKGRIAFNDHHSVINCIVRNLSSRGACLVVSSPLGVPDSFDLVIDSDAVTKPARVVWRKHDQVGVSFE